jgi:hypothetical protein
MLCLQKEEIDITSVSFVRKFEIIKWDKGEMTEWNVNPFFEFLFSFFFVKGIKNNFVKIKLNMRC